MSPAAGGRWTRRSFLGVVALGGAATLVAACAPGQTPAPTTAPTPAAPKPAAAPASPAPATSPAAAASPAVAASPAASPAAAPAISPAASPSQAAQPIRKPLPPNAFVPFGSNAEMRFEALSRDQYLVPAANFFVRDHASTPLVDEKTWKLSIEGSGVDKPFTLTYDELIALPSTTVTRYIECAGNGRGFYNELLHQPAQGTQWHLGAYGVAEWKGVRVAELLDRAGVKRSAVDVVGIGLDPPQVQRPMSIDKAMQDDTLVAYAMNGQPLLPDSGFPARLLTPGWIGVANIKWLGSLQVVEQKAYTDWNTRTYVLIGPDYQPQPPSLGPIINDQVMKSAVALPWPATLKPGSQTVWGYAWSPSGKISKVDVSLDGGASFQAARLIDPNVEKAGVRWELTFDARPGEMTITPRATDDEGNAQPTDPSTQKWNEQGYLFAVAVPHPVTVAA
jgi:DMSO/TMAO reductase YedYZ molybdopterin-dependent catalytic subunit